MLADLPHYYINLVHVEGLHEKLTACDSLVISCEQIVQSVSVSLSCGDYGLIRSDHSCRRDVTDGGVIHRTPDNQPVCSADYVCREVICLKVIHNLHHRKIVSAATVHALETRHGLFLELLHVVVELLRSHALEG